VTPDETKNLTALVDESRRLRAAAERAEDEANWAKTAWETAKHEARRAWDQLAPVTDKINRLIRGE
jgi:hypothetical protein